MGTAIEVGGTQLSVGGAGYVLWFAEDDEDIADGENYCTVSWDANWEAEEQDITDTCDFNVATGRMNRRSVITQDRLTGTMTFKHDLLKDVLALIGLGYYGHARLFINRGNAGVVGPPVIDATRQAYFDIPEIVIGPISIPAPDINGIRMISMTFKSNGNFTYVNRAYAATIA